jgi:predicted Zn-dependent protease
MTTNSVRTAVGFAFAACLLVSVAAAKDKKACTDPRKDPDQIGSRDVGTGVNFYSLEKEMALGKQMAQEVERQAEIIDDPVIAEYVNRIGQNLVRNSDAKVPFTIKVVHSDEVNAFALPGGFFFVNSGLILVAENEAELAGVMAHEIAHVAARHGTREASRGDIVTYASFALIFVGGLPGYLIQSAASVAIPMGFLRFSRGFESEADMLGLQYLYRAGYDPTALVDLFETIESREKKKPGTVARAFSSHPLTQDRIKAAQANIQRYLPSRPEYILNTSEFIDVKARLAALESGARVSDLSPSRPALRRAAGADGETSQPDENERPTLKRRD